MLSDLANEIQNDYHAERSKQEREHFEGKCGVLKFIYENPSRWDDTRSGCHLFPDINNVSEDMKVEMEKTFPDYRTHIKAIQDMKRNDTEATWRKRREEAEAACEAAWKALCSARLTVIA
jgi:hypothetical protein